MPGRLAVQHPAGDTTMSNIQNQQQPSRPQQQLRRAVYIHVSDLTSAYNIDHTRLEEELKRVKTEQEKPKEEAGTTRLGGVPTEFDTGASQRRLQPPRTGYNLCVLVGRVNVVVDKNRVDGTRVRLAEVEVGDETGTVSLRARDDQIDTLMSVAERNGAVVLRNCTLELYQGKHVRLAVTKWGKLSVYPDKIASTPPPPSKLNRDRNFSLIDLSLVASEMVTFTQENPYQQQPVEVENQAVSMVNRQPQQHQQQQQYHSSSTSTRGRGRRGPSHSMKGAPQPQQQPVPSPHYEPVMTSSLAYQTQAGLHQHGYTGLESPAYSYAPGRQPDKVPTIPPPPQQHMMFHHHPQQSYEMQHRQMQQQHMYHAGHQDRTLHAGTMLTHTGIPQASSFEASAYGTAASPPDISAMTGVPVLSNPFLVQVHNTGHNTPRRMSSSSLESPRMNPHASTFDPSQQNKH